MKFFEFASVVSVLPLLVFLFYVLLFFFFFWLGILTPQPGIELTSCGLEGEVLTIGPPGRC